MKKLAALMLAWLPIVLSGCVQTHMVTVIEKDGSGTFHMTYAMSASVAEALQEQSELALPPDQEQEDVPTLDDFDRGHVEQACREHGVKLEKFDRSVDDGREQVEFLLAFKCLDDLNGALGSLNGTSQLQLFRTADGNYALNAIPHEPPDEEPEPDAPGEDQPFDPQAMEDFDPATLQRSIEIMGKLMGSISELDISYRLTVPGDIISHNAQRVEGKTLIWEMNSESMMTAAGSMEPDVVFSGQGLKIEAPHLE